MRTCTTKLQKVRACVHDHAAVLFVGTVPTPLLHHWLAGPLPLGGAGAAARPLPCKSYVSPKAPRAPKLASTVTSWARRALYCMRHDPQGASPPYLIQQFAKHNDNMEKEQVNKIPATSLLKRVYRMYLSQDTRTQGPLSFWLCKEVKPIDQFYLQL